MSFGGRGGFGGTGLAIEKHTILVRLLTGVLRVVSFALAQFRAADRRSGTLTRNVPPTASLTATSRATATLTRVDLDETGELRRIG